jgi:hypothetical protein
MRTNEATAFEKEYYWKNHMGRSILMVRTVKKGTSIARHSSEAQIGI